MTRIVAFLRRLVIGRRLRAAIVRHDAAAAALDTALREVLR